MTRTLLVLSLSLALLPACYVQKIEAIIAKYDTIDWSGTSDASESSPASTSTGVDTTGDSEAAASTTTTTTTTGTVGDSHDASADSSAGSTADPDTTGPAPAVCGDGLVEGDEECDDANANDNDACFNDCTRAWLVFITSEPFTQGDIKGLIGADYQCRHRASKLFLPNGDRYMAWISTSEVQPADRMYHARGPYRLVNGDQVAANWDALVAGPLDNPIILNELGEMTDDLVFTGTTPEGWRAPNSTYCDDWTDNDGDNFTWYGYAAATDSTWTLVTESACGIHAALYCFEQP